MTEVEVGGRPAEVTKEGKDIRVIFHPLSKNAKHPKAKVFQIVLSKSDVEELKKALN